MTIISMIAAIDEQGGLGKDNELLCHLPADLKHFKEVTLGKPIIMGRKTHESIGRALPGRLNIVLSKHAIFTKDVKVAHSLDEALEVTKDTPEVMVIGGANIFAQALPLAHRVYLTIIRTQLVADVFFPALDKNTWQCKEVIDRPHDEKNPYDLSFCRYELTNKKLFDKKAEMSRIRSTPKGQDH